MTRILLTYLLPMIAPAITYMLWSLWRARAVRESGGERPAFEKGPLAWLVVAGVVFTLVIMGATALIHGAPAGTKYVPPTTVDGKVVPGRFE